MEPYIAKQVNKLYDNARTTAWNFYHNQEGSALPNIISFTKKEIASANISLNFICYKLETIRFSTPDSCCSCSRE